MDISKLWGPIGESFGATEDLKPSTEEFKPSTEDIRSAPMITAIPRRCDADLHICEYNEPSRQGRAYSPVYITNRNPDGGIEYTAYISGQITDTDNYVSLIDTLLTMRIKDSMTIYLDSPGGYVASGGLIASAIDNCMGTVKTVARGLCASAAALIHSAAKRENISVTPFAVMLYHMSSHTDAGVSTRIAQTAAKQVEYVNSTLLSKALKEGHITKEEFAKIQAGENIIVPAKVWVTRTAPKEDAE